MIALYTAIMEGEVILIAVREGDEPERKGFLREAEIRSLIATLGLNIIYTAHLTLREARSSTLIGKGQVEALQEAVRAYEPDEAIIDASITPRQPDREGGGRVPQTASCQPRGQAIAAARRRQRRQRRRREEDRA